MTKGKISEAKKLAGTKYSYFSNPIISYYFYPTDSNNFQLPSGGYPLLVNSSNALVLNILMAVLIRSPAIWSMSVHWG